jgi:type II secretory pathway pseudopilin PulG
MPRVLCARSPRFGHSNFEFDSSVARTAPGLARRLRHEGVRAFEFRASGFPLATRNSQLATAFTFIEVLFAVILLGIGFIMIAGVFPVAIQQTGIVTSETQATAITRDAIRKIQEVADAQIVGYPPSTSTTSFSLFQPTGTPTAPTVQAFSPNIMQALGSDCFYSADRRFGWAGFYRRDSTTSPYAQVFIVALQNPNFPNYTSQYLPGETTAIPAGSIPPAVAPPIPPNLYNYAGEAPATYTPSVAPAQPTNGVAAAISAQFYYNSDGTTTIVLAYNQSSTPVQLPNAASGAFALVANNVAPANNNMIGRFFRLGNAAPLPPGFTPTGTDIYDTYVAQSGWDITPADGYAPSTSTPPTPAFTANVFIVGRAPTLSSGTEFTGPFTGPNQDIGVASAFIRINTANN